MNTRGMIRFNLCALALLLLASTTAHAWPIYMPDSTNNRLVSFDENTGALLNSNVFPLPAGGRPQKAIQVGNEIWISEQLGDRVARYDLNGTFLSALGPTSPPMDNVRGLTQIGNVVYVCVAAGGLRIEKFDPSGASLGSTPTPNSSCYDILPYQGDILVTSDSGFVDVNRYSLTGVNLGPFHNSSTIGNVEQINYALNGDILVASNNPTLIARLNPNDGSLISSFQGGGGARGVIQLGNGNILWSRNTGAFVYDVNTGLSTQVYSGDARMFSLVPEPATMTLFLLGGPILLRRNRR